MILANVRTKFATTDPEHVIDVLADGDPDREEALRARLERTGLDVLLDDPELAGRLERADQVRAPSIALLLYVGVRHRLLALGIDDVELSEYLGALLLEFGRHQRAYRITGYDDATYRYLADIVADIDTADARRGFLLRAHLGNFSLWLSGVFPDHIAARRQRSGAPGLAYFEAFGRQGFRSAADHRLARDYDLAGVYARAADTFSALRIALNRLSDRLLFPNWHSPDRLLRQVADDCRTN